MTRAITIWGAGAIGGTLGAAFARAGHEVVFVDAVAEHVAAINRSGLRIVGPIFEDTIRARAVLPRAVTGTAACIFLCVKALHTREAAHQLLPHLSPAGVVVSAQNGLNEVTIAEVVGRDRTIGCFLNFGADYLEPGVIHYGGRAAVVVGELDGRRTDRIAELHNLLIGFEPRAVLTDNIWGYLWGKLVYGSLLFGIAVTNEGIADALADLRYRAVLTALGREVATVAAAAGIRMMPFDGFDPAAFLPGASQQVVDQSFKEMVAHNRSSTKTHSGIWRDLAVRKRKTETEALLGPVVDIGQTQGVPTPVTIQVITMITEIENGSRPLATVNLLELARGGTSAALT